ncbi:zf-HC2 domain-containing protein [Pseudonocardia ailaonensis]|uniref:Zf-HC2 domain-containing protein n=1 Tax=Pseudonocardia ailaonensis TaxID=367279 RepID=A0ABN2MNC6_9PSEU
MSIENHDGGELSAHVLGLLGPEDSAAVELHLETCAQCRAEWEDLRAMTRTLDELPDEALLEGPPDSDLVLHRALREIREERAGQRRRRVLTRAVAAVVVAAALVGGGAAIGSTLTPSTPTPTVVAGARTAQVTEGAVTAAVTVTPANGWVRLAANVKGVPAGEHCRLVVVAKDGSREVAGGWVVPPTGEANGVHLDGAAGIPPDQVQSVVVENTDGHSYAQVVV